MFGNLREKLYSVGKSVKLFTETKTTPEPPKINVNLNAGAHILSHFQSQWEELHELNEDNAKNSDELAQLIEDMYKKISSDHRNICDMSYLICNGTQNLSDSVTNCVAQIKQLSVSFERVENDLIRLENLIENLELQEKELEHRFQLALYKEKKLANLEALRLELAEKHVQSVTEFERKQQQTLQERQRAFQDAFQTDLQLYKEAGTLPSKLQTTVPENFYILTLDH